MKDSAAETSRAEERESKPAERGKEIDFSHSADMFGINASQDDNPFTHARTCMLTLIQVVDMFTVILPNLPRLTL